MTAVIFPDPQPATRDALRALLEGRTEPHALGATVSTKAALQDGARPLPWIQVRSVGQYRDAQLNGRATMRVTVWHRDEGAALSLAGLLEALLLDYSGEGVRGVSPATGPLPADDPDTGEPISFFTVTARLRPATLT